MTETMLVRASGGGWEELQPQTTMPEGGLVDLFGEDIGPVLGATGGVVVAACAPPLSTGAPAAICLDPQGGVWIVELSMAGAGEMILPNLLSFGGALSGMAYDDFEALCDRRDGDSLAGFMEGRTRGDGGFHRGSFEVAVREALGAGRFHLVAIVREAAPTLVQSMRFLNRTGAMGSVYEASSFASASVSAVRATAIDVGGEATGRPAAPTAAPAAEAPAPAPTSQGGDAFLAAVGRSGNDPDAALMAQLQASCLATFDDVTYEGEGDGTTMHAVLDSDDGPAAVLVAGSDGSIVVSFESLGALDASWTVRDELCQGMERLLGADLGEVRKISQLNLSVQEHLMDATLMEALGELLADTVAALRGASAGARTRARQTAAA
ncbi:MAG: hypothetical protein JWM98_1360 [Thermoleophilia bacterium]|nr:hypothetical protein [Thermoleophilia bacterium]